MSSNLQKILWTNGSVVEIRGLGLTNEELVAVAGEIATLPDYRGEVEYEKDAVTGETLPVRERVAKLKALASAVVLAQR